MHNSLIGIVVSEHFSQRRAVANATFKRIVCDKILLSQGSIQALKNRA